LLLNKQEESQKERKETKGVREEKEGKKRN
jgi:hypothetical protein